MASEKQGGSLGCWLNRKSTPRSPSLERSVQKTRLGRPQDPGHSVAAGPITDGSSRDPLLKGTLGLTS